MLVVMSDDSSELEAAKIFLFNREINFSFLCVSTASINPSLFLIIELFHFQLKEHGYMY